VCGEFKDNYQDGLSYSIVSKKYFASEYKDGVKNGQGFINYTEGVKYEG
jgi:hypothetical protein